MKSSSGSRQSEKAVSRETTLSTTEEIIKQKQEYEAIV